MKNIRRLLCWLSVGQAENDRLEALEAYPTPNERNLDYDAIAGTSPAKNHSKKNKNKKP
jgi:hypothetical protein